MLIVLLSYVSLQDPSRTVRLHAGEYKSNVPARRALSGREGVPSNTRRMEDPRSKQTE